MMKPSKHPTTLRTLLRLCSFWVFILSWFLSVYFCLFRCVIMCLCLQTYSKTKLQTTQTTTKHETTPKTPHKLQTTCSDVNNVSDKTPQRNPKKLSFCWGGCYMFYMSFVVLWVLLMLFVGWGVFANITKQTK